MALDFDTLTLRYPKEKTKAELFDRIGGGWPALISNKNYDNTCTVRLSIGLIACGVSIPNDLAAQDGGHTDAEGKKMIVKVPTAKTLLERILGPSAWSITKKIGVDIGELLPRRTGILLYLVPGDPTGNGHVDLWKKDHCTIDCHIDYARNSTSVELWYLD
jgi:hypothetical protein